MSQDKLDTVEMRRARIRQVLGILNSSGEIDYTKALGICCYNVGVSKDKVREYFSVLKDSNRITVKDGFITVNKSDTSKAGKEANGLLNNVAKPGKKKKEGKHAK